jgi:hypothetical protein
MLSILEFKTDYRIGKEPVDMVLIAPKGEGHQKTQTWHRVSKLTPPKDADDTTKESLSYQDMAAKWSVIGPAYKAFKENSEIPETGTPLAVWSGVTTEMASALKSMGFKTVEDVRDMGDGAVGKLPFPNARSLPGLAAKFLEGADAVAKDAENAELKERLAALEELLAQNMAAKPKRGRPAKTQGEAA